MSQELVRVTAPMALSIPPEEAAAVQEAFAINMRQRHGLGVRPAPDQGDERSGALAHPRPGGRRNRPQDRRRHRLLARCAGVLRVQGRRERAARLLLDGRHHGHRPGQSRRCEYGGACQACPLAKWDSAQDGGAGQACKQVKQLFMLRGESMLPEVVSLPPTSLKAARQSSVKLTTQGIPYYGALVADRTGEGAERGGQGVRQGRHEVRAQALARRAGARRRVPPDVPAVLPGVSRPARPRMHAE